MLSNRRLLNICRLIIIISLQRALQKLQKRTIPKSMFSLNPTINKNAKYFRDFRYRFRLKRYTLNAFNENILNI